MPLFVDKQTDVEHPQDRPQSDEERNSVMREIRFSVMLMMMGISCLDLAHIPVPGNFDPFADETPPSPSDDQSSQTNDTQPEQAGPSLDIVDFHPREDEENNASTKGLLIQPSIDFLDAQLHGGDEHIHQKKKKTQEEEAAANLDDYHRWLKEQTETDQLQRFLLLQKEVNSLRLDNSQDLSKKLNQTIEELKLAASKSQPTSET